MMPSEKSTPNAADQTEHGTSIACAASEATMQKEKNKLVRRALSMPRNLFRLSRRVKLTSSSKMSNHKSTDQNDTAAINSDHSVTDTLNGTAADNVSATLNGSSESQTISDKSLQSKRNRLFHRSTWKRLLTRVAHQMTLSNNAVRLYSDVSI